ncbi:MAG: hypothetical protein KTR21_15640 [Rhodobacteraceae bacterium]|nr:hypothetical protein [Paracoccaceae bacterium]
MSRLNAAIEQFEAAMARLETAADQFSERQRAATESATLASPTPEQLDGGPVAEALRVAEAELTRLRLENDALRAVGVSADTEAFERAAADADAVQSEIEIGGSRRSNAAK